MTQTGSNPYQTIQGLIVLGRPVDGVIIGSTAVLGMIVGLRSMPSLPQILLGLLCGILLLAGMDTFNDYLDIEMDKISKPWRPLPQGTVSRQLALVVSITETIIAIVVGTMLFNLQAIFVGIIAVLMAIIYSKWLKPIFLAKNIIVAVSLSLAFLGGTLSVNSAPKIDHTFLLLQLLTFVAAFIFEIHKDLGDLTGDSTHAVQTLPIKIGQRKTVNFIILGYILAWCIAVVFIWILEVDLFYFMILFLAAILLCLVFYLLIKDPLGNVELTRKITTLVMGFILLGLARVTLLTFS
ncbi:MAG: UbiA family prenyltransferase [Candidatus Hodarchaeales archaeon]|jgi:4-hydroxybenzoate polyprenyltransferase